MASVGKDKGSRIAVWAIMVLLIVGLAGFGATNFGGTVNSVGTVGDREIDVNRYARELQNQIRAFSAQTGQNITVSQAREFGIDQAVLRQLVTTAALENEASQLGLSAGDEEVRTQILAIQSFQGLDGEFDREAYRFTLEQSGLNERDFENNLRAEIARTMVQGAVAGGVVTPDAFTDTLVNYIGERRSFVWAMLGVDALATPIANPTDADLMAYYEANQDDFMLPETRKISYVWLTPDMIVDSIEIDEVALRELYDSRIEDYVKPERRIVERLILGNTAADAKARLDANEISFEELVAERDLALADIDLGDVTEAELGDAGEAVFAPDAPGIIGPVETSLGAALYRINAILAAQETPFEDARTDLVDEFALDRARRTVGNGMEDIDDLLAGGATLEELAAETEMQLGQIDWTLGDSEGIAGYEAFRAAAASTQTGDFAEVAELEDGGLFALTVDEIIAPRVEIFENAKGQVESGWRAAETAKALAAQADAMVADLQNGGTAETLGLDLTEETHATRESFIADTPTGFLDTVFNMQTGAAQVVRGETAAYIVRLDEIAGPDLDAEDMAERRELFSTATAQGIGSDILSAYTATIEAKAGVSLNQLALNAVHAQFP